MTAEHSTDWLSEPLVLSRYLQHLVLTPGEHLLTHGVFGHPFRLKATAWESVRHFATPTTMLEAAARAELPFERLQRIAEPLVRQGLLVRAGADEEADVRARFIAPDGFRRVHQPAWVGSALMDPDEAIASDAPLKQARVLILGACFAHGVEALLENRGHSAGFDLALQLGPTDGWALAESWRPDVVIFQLPGSIFLRPLLDHFHALAPEEVVELLQAFLGYVEHALQQLESACGDALVLVHGYALPQHSPLGHRECRAEVGFFETLRAANQGILEACRRRARFHFIDEDRLFGNHGKRTLQDDMLNVYSHHGALDYAERIHGKPAPHERSVLESFGASEAAAERVLVDEYLSLMTLHLAPDPIKCVVVDLDGTLWPGAIGDAHFDLGTNLPWLTQYRFAGLHQALKILKSRGVLLAIASKNNPDDVWGGWHYPLGGEAPRPGSPEERQVLTQHYKGLYSTEAERVYRTHERHALMHLHLLRPDDFVTTRIGWEPKSQMIRSIAQELGVSLSHIAFLDDSPIERAEVRHHLPDVWVLGDDPNLWRETMLSSQRFEHAHASAEAARRTETTRGRLQREAAQAAATDPAAFLATLDLRCTVSLVEDESALGRLHELLTRTNQMNLTSRRHDMARLQAFLRDPQTRLYALNVQDRFSDHGRVGAAIVCGNELDTFVVSCRVMGLGVEDAFLSAMLALEARVATSPHLQATYIPTARNVPIRDLLPRLGFTPTSDTDGGGSTYSFSLAGERPPIPSHCAVTVRAHAGS
jgi:FkbH-like protein